MILPLNGLFQLFFSCFLFVFLNQYFSYVSAHGIGLYKKDVSFQTKYYAQHVYYCEMVLFIHNKNKDLHRVKLMTNFT